MVRLFDNREEDYLDQRRLCSPKEALQEDRNKILYLLNKWHPLLDDYELSVSEWDFRFGPLEEDWDFTDNLPKISCFPGAKASGEEFAKWLSRLNEIHQHEIEETYLEPEEIAAAIIYDACPDHVGLIMKVDREQFKSTKIEDDNLVTEYMMRSLAIIGDIHMRDTFVKEMFRDDGDDKLSRLTWANYKKWILENQKGDVVIIGSTMIHRDIRIDELVKKWIKKFGIERYVNGWEMLHLKEINDKTGEDCIWRKGLYAGENYHVPTSEDGTQQDLISKFWSAYNEKFEFCVEVILEMSNPKEHLSEFEEAMFKTRLASNLNLNDEGSWRFSERHSRDFIVIAKGEQVTQNATTTFPSSTDISTPERKTPAVDVTPETDSRQFRANVENLMAPVPKSLIPVDKDIIWIPSLVHMFEQRLKDRFYEGTDETFGRRDILRYNTGQERNNLCVSIFENEIDYVMNDGMLRIFFQKQRFAAALALVKFVVEDTESSEPSRQWLLNNNVKKDVELLMKDISEYFRLHLLKLSDEQLGISIAHCIQQDQVDETADESPARLAIYRLLDHYRQKFDKWSSKECKLIFNWRLRKRKTSSTASIEHGQKKARKETSNFKSATANYKPNERFEHYTQKNIEALQEKIQSVQNEFPSENESKKLVWQIKCITGDDDITSTQEHIRVIVLTGNISLFGLAKLVAEVYSWRPAGTRYETATTKGVLPAGSYWKINMEDCEGLVGTQKEIYKVAGKGAPFLDLKKVKVYQVLREYGDELVFECSRGSVEVVVQGIETKVPTSHFGNYRDAPRLVGAFPISSSDWHGINMRLLGNRAETKTLLMSRSATEEERFEAFSNHWKYPVFDEEGNLFKDYEERLDLFEQHNNILHL